MRSGASLSGRTRSLVSRLDRRVSALRPARAQLATALRATLAIATGYGAAAGLAHALAMPTLGTFLAFTLAQFVALFLPAGPRAERAVTGLLSVLGGMAGTGFAVALVPAGPWGLAALVPLTGAAFAAETRGPRPATAALAVVYAYAFALFFGPDPAWAAWHLGAAATGGLTALAVLVLPTPLDRPPTRRQLAASHAAALSLFLDEPGAAGALERMRITARAAEMALADRGGVDLALAERLAEARLLAEDLALVPDALPPDAVSEIRAALGAPPGSEEPEAPAATALGAWARRLAKEPPAEPVSPRSEAKPRRPAVAASETARRAALAALATGLALLLGTWVSPDRWAWSYIAAVFLFTGTPSMGHVFVRGWGQLRGTVAGVALGLAIAAIVQGQQAAGIVALVVLQILYLYIRVRHQVASVAVLTAWLGVFFGLTGDPVGQVLLLRIEETLAGAAAGFVAARLVRPHATEAQVRAEAAELLHGLAETVRTPGAPRAVEGRLGDALAALRDTSAPRSAPFARPGRRMVGRRFALMERAVHFTHLLRLADRFGEAPTPTEAATQERLAEMATKLAHAVSAGRAPHLPPFYEDDFAAGGLRGRALRGLNSALRELAWGVGG